MKTVIEPQTILLFNGKLVVVDSISQGRVIHMRPLEERPCGLCGHTNEVSVLEHSPLFQEKAEPVPTVKDTSMISLEGDDR